AKQEPHPGHDAIAVADAHAGLSQVQLEPADVLARGRIKRSLQKCSEPLAAGDVAALRVRTKLARVHVLDHALAQRTDSIGGHRRLLPWVRWIDTSILKTGDLARYRRSLLVDSARAPPRRRLSRSDLDAMAHHVDSLRRRISVAIGAKRT